MKDISKYLTEFADNLELLGGVTPPTSPVATLLRTAVE